MIDGGVALSTAAYSLIGGGGFGFSFLVVRWFATFTAGRVDKRADQVDKQADKVDAGMTKLLDSLEKRLDEEERSRLAEIARRERVEEELRREIGKLRTDLAECERRHGESEARVKHLEATMLGMGDARQRAQLIVSDEKRKAKEA